VSKSDYQKDYKELWDKHQSMLYEKKRLRERYQLTACEMKELSEKYQAAVYDLKASVEKNEKLVFENEIPVAELKFFKPRKRVGIKIAIGFLIALIVLDLSLIYGYFTGGLSCISS